MECVRACVGGGSHTTTLNAIGGKNPKLFDSCVLWEGISTKWNLLDITSFIATPLNRCHRQLLRLRLHVVIPAAHPEWTVPYPQWEDGIDPARTIPRPRWMRD